MEKSDIKKEKIVIVSSSYPYGNVETFLENEIEYLSRHFDILVIPTKKKNRGDKPRVIPNNLVYTPPIISENYLKRILRGIFNLSPIISYVADLRFLINRSSNVKESLKQWFIRLITNRTLESSSIFKNCLNDSDIRCIYFYWANFPIAQVKHSKKDFFIRTHGGEVEPDRNHKYIPMAKYIFINEYNIKYLPISEKSRQQISNINKVNLIVNRLGVYDHGLNPSNQSGIITIVSCSNLIPLKRVHLIIEALMHLKENVSWIHFGDGVEMKVLKELSQKLPSNINTEFRGRIENKKILEFYQMKHVDLFMNVSETEGVPVSIMEALSFGIPCFATNVGGTSEIINDTVGKLVEKDFNIEILSNFIITIRQRSESFQLRENARLQWSRLCDAETNYEKLALTLRNKK